MPNLASPVAAASAASFPADSPSADGWRGGDLQNVGLTALRAELDQIDDAMHDLLIQRAKVVEQVSRSGKRAAFRPGREASIVRRLIKRHSGALPRVTLFRIWRELLAGTTSMQGNFSLAVCDADPGASLTQLAREHFGALTPLRFYGSATEALVGVSHGAASVAMLPFPSEAATWWVALPHHEPRLHIVARLPFWCHRPDGAPMLQALAVATAASDPSGEDRSFLVLECDSDVSRTCILSELTAAGLPPDATVLIHGQAALTAYVLADVAGYLSDDDPRLARLDGVVRQPVVVGHYAVPVAESAA